MLKGILIILMSNMLNLILSLTRNFVLPKYLSIATYADIKTYQLFISVSGILALGYIDGMYLKYGGENLKNIDKQNFLKTISTFRLFQLLLSVLLMGIALYFQNVVLIYAILTSLFVNLIDYFKCFFQATGEFYSYSKILNYSSILIFLANMVLIFIFQQNQSSPFLLSYVLVYFFVWLILEIRVSKALKIKMSYTIFSFQELKNMILTGFSLMIGLFCSNFISVLDLWFAKFTFNTEIFVFYSFSAGTLGFLSYVISPISVSLYNYLCKYKNKKNNKILKQSICIFITLIVSGAFVIKFIFEIYLTKYYNAYKILFLLFTSQIFFGVIKCFYTNLYKSAKKQFLFFKKICIILILGAIFNIVLYLCLKNELSYAIGTILTSLVWYFLCEVDFKDYRSIKDLLYIILSSIFFIALGWNLKSYYGLLTYLFLEILLSYFFMKDAIIIMWDYIKKKFKKRLD